MVFLAALSTAEQSQPRGAYRKPGVSADGSTLPCAECYFWLGDSLVSWIQHHSLDLLTDRILLLLGKQDVDAHYANSQP